LRDGDLSALVAAAEIVLGAELRNVAATPP